MKKTLLLFFFILLNSQIFSQLNQGDVLIKSFDPSMSGNYFQEYVVLVNHTSSTINLQGYQIKCYKFDGTPVSPVYDFGQVTLLPPYGFYLISTETNLYGLNPDVIYLGPRIDADGYLTIRKSYCNST